MQSRAKVGIPPTVPFVSQDCFRDPVCLFVCLYVLCVCFHMNQKLSFQNLLNSVGILMGIALNL